MNEPKNNFALLWFNLNLFFKRKAPINFRYKVYILGIFLGWLLLFLSDLPDENFHNHSTVCIIKNITGYPCPCCGTTRALKFLVHFHFADALYVNPTSYIIAILAFTAFFMMLYDLSKHKTTFNDFFSRKIHPALIVLIVVYLIFNEFFNIYKGL